MPPMSPSGVLRTPTTRNVWGGVALHATLQVVPVSMKDQLILVLDVSWKRAKDFNQQRAEMRQLGLDSIEHNIWIILGLHHQCVCLPLSRRVAGPKQVLENLCGVATLTLKDHVEDFPIGKVIPHKSADVECVLVDCLPRRISV
jgi:hypothetical protein